MLSRRGFLVVGSAAASLTLVGNREVMALVGEADRYHVSVATAQNLVTRAAVAGPMFLDRPADAVPLVIGTRISALQGRTYPNSTRNPQNEAWIAGSEYPRWLTDADDFFADLVRRFPEDAPVKETIDLFDGRVPADMMAEESLRGLVPGVVPLALTREMVMKHRVPFHLGKLKNFTMIADKYRHVVRLMRTNQNAS